MLHINSDVLTKTAPPTTVGAKQLQFSCPTLAIHQRNQEVALGQVSYGLAGILELPLDAWILHDPGVYLVARSLQVASDASLVRPANLDGGDDLRKSHAPQAQYSLAALDNHREFANADTERSANGRQVRAVLVDELDNLLRRYHDKII